MTDRSKIRPDELIWGDAEPLDDDELRGIVSRLACTTTLECVTALSGMPLNDAHAFLANAWTDVRDLLAALALEREARAEEGGGRQP